jgi:DNA (cytosine-5)-methyltransferase 1
MTSRKLRCVSLFSGCGGLDLGVKRAGFEIVFASDIEPLCALSHARNFRGVPFHTGSVSEVSAEVLSAHIGRAKIDLVVGGPPCPPFSKSRFYRKEKPRGLKDPVGLETFDGYLNVLEALRPRAFILENVAGLAYDVHRESLDHVLRRARGLGYTTKWRVLNAADFGVPQIRERCFVVGLLGDAAFEFPPPTHAKEPEQRSIRPWKSAGEVLADLDTDENASDEGHFAGGKHHDLLKLVPPGENYLHFTKERGHPSPKFRWRSRYWSFLLKLSPTMPSWTIQARRSNNMGPLHWRNRILRIAEVKRLQTFPDSWFLSGTVEQQWRQVGNAVPPLLAERVARAVAEQIPRRAR